MAVAVDAVGPSSAGTSSSSSTTLSWSHTCTGSQLCLVVGIAVGFNPDGGITASAKYNNVAMTSAGNRHSNDQNYGWVELFYLVAPATGANTVAITTSSSVTSIIGGSISFTGVHQTTPIGTPVTAIGSASPASAVVAGTTVGNMVVDAFTNGNSITSSAQTNRWLKNLNNLSGAGNAAQSTANAGGSVTMSYTTTADWWSMIAVEMKSATAAALRTPRPRVFSKAVNRAANW